MLIRNATPHDLPFIRALEQASETAAHWAEGGYDALFAPEAPRRIALVIAQDADEQICGFAIARCSADEWEIENVVVAPEHQRRGLGSALVSEVLKSACHAGATSVLLEVRESNRPARQLYEKLNFREAGRRKNYYHQPDEDALILKNSVSFP
jgi:[ribosomal protein S18]-alanine N-acetyltransferase